MLVSISPVLVLKIPEFQSDIIQVYRIEYWIFCNWVFSNLRLVLWTMLKHFLLDNINHSRRCFDIIPFTDRLPFLGSFPTISPPSVLFASQVNHLHLNFCLKVCVWENLIQYIHYLLSLTQILQLCLIHMRKQYLHLYMYI